MDFNYPIHIKQLIEDVEAGGEVVPTLLAAVPALNRDSTLYNVYISLGYSPEHGRFLRRVAAAEVLAQLQSHYTDAVPAPEPVQSEVELNGHDQEPADEGQAKEVKGLKNLSLKVKDIICRKGCISYKQVADELIRDMGMTENDKEAKNILRRVYDALNVLISVGIIVKVNKRYIWQGIATINDSASLADRNDAIMSKRSENQGKRDALFALTTKFFALRGLIERNQVKPVPEEVIRLPFIIVSTEEAPTKNIKIEINRSKTYLTARFSRPIQLTEDQDVLVRLKVQSSTETIPDELVRLLNPDSARSL